MNKLSIPRPPEIRRHMARQGDLIWITKRENVYILARVTSDDVGRAGLSIVSLDSGNIWSWNPLYTRESSVDTKTLSAYIGLSNEWGFAEGVTVISQED